MARWEYKAYGKEGATVRGRLTAESEVTAYANLERLGLVPIELHPILRRTKRQYFRSSGNRLEANLLLIRQLANLIQSGIPMLRAITSLSELQADDADRERVQKLSEALRQGQPLSQSLRNIFPALPPYVPYLIEVGETTGEMTAALANAADQLERDLAVSREIRGALTYPLFLVVFGIVAVGFMFAVVVPQFAGMLKKGDASLPTISRIVITAGTGMREYFLEIGMTIAGIAAMLLLLSKRPKAAEAMYQIVLSLPGIGRVIRLTESARWSAMLATLLASRVTITDAILVANRIVKDGRLRRSLDLVESSLRRGSGLADALEDFTSLDLRVVEMVRIGEQTGGLDRMLASAAELLRHEAESGRKRFMALIEPMAVLLIGAAIGTIVVGLMLAISSLYDRVL